jgi:hypothetical protein
MQKKAKLIGLSVSALLITVALFSASAWASGAPENTGKPTILGGSELGSVEHASKGTWTNEPTSYAYQWQRCNASGLECVNISGAKEAAYTVVFADHGHTLLVKVTASNASGEGLAYSKPTKIISPVHSPEFIPANHLYPVRYEFSSGPSYFEAANGYTLTCSGLSGSGKFAGPNEITEAHMSLAGCSGGTTSCTTLEAGPLIGHLGYINEAAKTVGLELEAPSGLFASFRCAGSVSVRGRIIGEIGPVNVSRSQFSLSYQIVPRGIQQIHQLQEGVPGGQLEWSQAGGPFENWAIRSFPTLITTQFGEIVA